MTQNLPPPKPVPPPNQRIRESSDKPEPSKQETKWGNYVTGTHCIDCGYARGPSFVAMVANMNCCPKCGSKRLDYGAVGRFLFKKSGWIKRLFGFDKYEADEFYIK